MFGDAVHNLKCALDYAWVQTVEQHVPSAVGKFSKFPVYRTIDDLKGALRGAKVDTSSPSLFNLIVTEIKPYDGGDLAIWPVHRLDIRDKHKLLLPAAYYSSIEGIEVENEMGEVEPKAGTWGTMQKPPWYIPMPLGYHVKNKGKPAITVILDEGEFPDQVLDVETLLVYSHFISKIVETLEGFLQSAGG